MLRWDNENGMMMIRPAARNLSLIFELDKRDPKTMGKETRKVFQSRFVSVACVSLTVAVDREIHVPIISPQKSPLRLNFWGPICDYSFLEEGPFPDRGIREERSTKN